LVDFCEIQQGDHDIEGVLDTIIFNQPTIKKELDDIQTSEVGVKLASVSLGLSRVNFGNETILV
jgi:hypothetical protein